MSVSNAQPVVFRDNSEWLRYALLGGAIGMVVLVADNLIGLEHDIGKIIGGSLGALLLGFSGYVLQVRRLVVDPQRREIMVTSKGLTKIVTDQCRFDEVTKLLLLLTYDRDENLLPANQQSERWSVVIVLKDRQIPVNVNPHTSKDQAMADAKRIQQWLNVEISDNVDESITHLAKNGRIIDAVVTASQTKGMPLAQANDYVKSKTGRSS